MTSPDPRCPRRQRQGPRAVGCSHLGGTHERSEYQEGRLFLLPLEASEGPRHPDTQGVLDPGRRLSHPKHAAPPVVEAEHGGGIIVGEAIGDYRTDLGCHLRDFDPGDEPDQVVGMGTDVAHAQRWSASHRVVSPRQSQSRVRVVSASFATLYVLHLNQSNLAQLTVLDHRWSWA